MLGRKSHEMFAPALAFLLALMLAGCVDTLIERKSAEFGVTVTMPGTPAPASARGAETDWSVSARLEDKAGAVLQSVSRAAAAGSTVTLPFDGVDTGLVLRVVMELSEAGSVEPSYKGESGWFTTAGGKNQVNIVLTRIQTDDDTGGTTIYTVTFNTDGGSEVAAQIVGAGETASKPDDPTKAGYTFGGWYVASDASGSAFDFTTLIDGNITLYAKWTQDSTGTGDDDTGSGTTTAYYVSAAGSDETGDGTEGSPFGSVQKAIDSMSDYNQEYTVYVLDDLDYSGADMGDNDSVISIVPGIAAAVDGGTQQYLVVTISGGDSDATIKAGRDSSSPGRVMFINGYAKVTLENITLSSGYHDNGAGVCITGSGTLTLGSGAVISGNTATNGGGVYADNGGSLVLDGGEIKDNTAADGGGIYTGNNSEIHINAGKISGNEATGTGGGIYHYNQDSGSRLEMTGGEVTGNIASVAGGIFLDNGTDSYFNCMEVYISGKVTVTGNKAGDTESNFYLPAKSDGSVGQALTVAGSLTGSSVYVTLGDGHPGTFTSGYGTHNTADPSSVFTSDAGYTVGWNEGDGTEAALTASGGDDGGDDDTGGDTDTTTHTVTFDTDGGSAVDAQTVVAGETATEPNAPTKTGYTFGGWYDASGSAFDFATAINEDTTLYAKWSANVYTVTFDANADALGDVAVTGEMPDQEITYGSADAKLSSNSFVATGYTFAGWNTQADGGGTSYANGADVSGLTADTTLYAQWTQDSTGGDSAGIVEGAYYVSANGNDDSNNGLSTDAPFSTLSKAIEQAASSGSNTVYVIGTVSESTATASSSGVYIQETVGTQDNPIVIAGYPDSGATLTADSRRVLYVSADSYITLKDLTITGGNVSQSGGAIYFYAAGSLTLENCTVEGNESTSTISGFSDAYSDGIHVGSDCSVVLKNTTVSDNIVIDAATGSPSSVAVEDGCAISGKIYLTSDASSVVLSGNPGITGGICIAGGDNSTSKTTIPSPAIYLSSSLTTTEQIAVTYESYQDAVGQTLVQAQDGTVDIATEVGKFSLSDATYTLNTDGTIMN